MAANWPKASLRMWSGSFQARARYSDTRYITAQAGPSGIRNQKNTPNTLRWVVISDFSTARRAISVPSMPTVSIFTHSASKVRAVASSPAFSANWIDWMPVRLTAIAFAVVGNFEDAIYAWRNFAGRWADESKGIILAAGGGAMGVRLGSPLETAPRILPADAATVDLSDSEADVLPGEEPNVRALQSTVGLVWRALLLWMLLLLLLSGAVWLG